MQVLCALNSQSREVPWTEEQVRSFARTAIEYALGYADSLAAVFDAFCVQRNSATPKLKSVFKGQLLQNLPQGVNVKYKQKGLLVCGDKKRVMSFVGLRLLPK